MFHQRCRKSISRLAPRTSAPLIGVVPIGNTTTYTSCVVLLPEILLVVYVSLKNILLIFWFAIHSFVIHRETAAAPSFDTAALLKLTSRLESLASDRPPMDDLNAKKVSQSSRESPFIVTGLIRIVVYWTMVDFVPVGFLIKRSSYRFETELRLLWCCFV
jgi:hypothetical protein